MKMEGIITPLLTPFHRDVTQRINEEATVDLLEHLIKKGVKGIFILGSNGEFHTLDEASKIAFAKLVIKVVNHRVPVYVGVGCCSTQETIALAKQMEQIGADALSVITPYFIKPSDDELYAHYKAVAESVKLPIVLYNIPKSTGCNLSGDVVNRLADIENIQGIKDSSGSEENMRAYAEVCKHKDLQLLIGSDSKISMGYALGATGAVAGTSNVITSILVSLDKALNEKNTKLAEALQKDIDVLREVLPLGTVPSVMKRACELANIAQVGPARLPVLETSKETDEKIIAMLRHYNLYEETA